MSRRNALAQLAALPLMAAAGASTAAETKVSLKIMMKSAWGSDDPTKAAFPFLHGNALAEAGHTVSCCARRSGPWLREIPIQWAD